MCEFFEPESRLKQCHVKSASSPTSRSGSPQPPLRRLPLLFRLPHPRPDPVLGDPRSNSTRPPSFLPLRALARLTLLDPADTILFFGSARAKAPEEHAAELARVTAALAAEPSGTEKHHKLTRDKSMLERTAWMSDYYVKSADLARRLTIWSMSRRDRDGFAPYLVSTGGGPGMMEAANRGAASVPGARTIGMGISLPFESGLNPFVSPELGFEFHYFSSRKFWMVYTASALIVTPGGLGTLDELFEVMTLLQTGKIGGRDRSWKKTTPIVLLGGSYWRRIINLEAGVELGTMSQSDLDRLFFTDSVDEAFDHVVTRLLEMELERASEEGGPAHGGTGGGGGGGGGGSGAETPYTASLHVSAGHHVPVRLREPAEGLGGTGTPSFRPATHAPERRSSVDLGEIERPTSGPGAADSTAAEPEDEEAAAAAAQDNDSEDDQPAK